MFRPFQRSWESIRSATPRGNPTRRAFIFGAALLLLWLLLQIKPTDSNRESAVFSDNAGTVAVGMGKERDGWQPFSLGNVAAVLLLVGGVGLAWYLHRRNGSQQETTATLQPLAHLHLAPQQQLRLVRCGQDALLLGVTAGQITLLKAYALQDLDLNPNEAVDPEQKSQPATSSRPTSFADLLWQQAGASVNMQSVSMP